MELNEFFVVHSVLIDVFCCLFRRQLAELESEKSLVAGLRCEIDELHQSHASQLEQYSEKTQALTRYRWIMQNFSKSVPAQ